MSLIGSVLLNRCSVIQLRSIKIIQGKKRLTRTIDLNLLVHVILKTNLTKSEKFSDRNENVA